MEKPCTDQLNPIFGRRWGWQVDAREPVELDPTEPDERWTEIRAIVPADLLADYNLPHAYGELNMTIQLNLDRNRLDLIYEHEDWPEDVDQQQVTITPRDPRWSQILNCLRYINQRFRTPNVENPRTPSPPPVPQRTPPQRLQRPISPPETRRNLVPRSPPETRRNLVPRSPPGPSPRATNTPPPDKMPARKCEAKTLKGTVCSRDAQTGSIYCWQHNKAK